MNNLKSLVSAPALLFAALTLCSCASNSMRQASRHSTLHHSTVRLHDGANMVSVPSDVDSEILGELTAALEPKPMPSADELRVQNETNDRIEKAAVHGKLVGLGVTHATSKHSQLSVEVPPVPLKKISSLETSRLSYSEANETPLIFDIPVTYNQRVSQWIKYFQNDGRRSFHKWLERSARFIPILQDELTRAGLPQDLIYVAMIESGFRHDAVSHAGAMGLWQFMKPTARRYGLRVDWWIDERKDFFKSTRAAIGYMADLYQQFGSWYLVAASYNMGEGGVRRLIARHGTNSFWDLADRGVLPRETTDYVPKIIAAMLISKAPALYGFRDLNYQSPLSFEYSSVPGGTNLENLADHLGVSEKYLKDMNPELIRGYVPDGVRAHQIRVPKGSLLAVSQYIGMQTAAQNSAQNRIERDATSSIGTSRF